MKTEDLDREWDRLHRQVINPREVFDLAEAAVRTADPDAADWMIENLDALCNQIQDQLLATGLNKLVASNPTSWQTHWHTRRGDVIDQYPLGLRAALTAKDEPLPEAWSTVLERTVYGVRDDAERRKYQMESSIRTKLANALPLTDAERALILKQAAKPADRGQIDPRTANTYPTPEVVDRYVAILKEILKEHPEWAPTMSKHTLARPSMDVAVDTSVTYDPKPAWMRPDPTAPLRKNPLPANKPRSNYKDEGTLWWFHRQMTDRYAKKFGSAEPAQMHANALDFAIVRVLAPEGMPPQPQRGTTYSPSELAGIVSVLRDTWAPLWQIRAFGDRVGGERALREALNTWVEQVSPITFDPHHYRSLWSRKLPWARDEIAALQLDVDEKNPDVYPYTPANLAKLAVYALQRMIPKLNHEKLRSDTRLYGFGADPEAVLQVMPDAVTQAWDVRSHSRDDRKIPILDRIGSMPSKTWGGEYVSAGGIPNRRPFAAAVLKQLRKLGIPYGQTRVPWTTLKRAVEAAGGTWVKKDRNGTSEITPDPKLGLTYVYRGTAGESADRFAHMTVTAMVAEMGLKPLDTPAKR